MFALGWHPFLAFATFRMLFAYFCYFVIMTFLFFCITVMKNMLSSIEQLATSCRDSQ